MKKIVSAKSGDRSILAARHPFSGQPEEWLNSVIAFDFFVDWSSWTVQNEIWVKGILETGEVPPEDGLEEYLREYYPSFDDLRNYAASCRMDLHYMLFDDGQDWKRDDSLLYDVHFHGDRAVTDVVSLESVKERIQQLSGGSVSVGSKGLVYSTSRLEAELSHTEYAWPGDVDGIILKTEGREPLAILEYKKHTKEGNYISSLEFYENHKDRRKYNRLELLRETFHPGIPIIVVTFPTRTQFTQLMLECIQVDLKRQHMHLISDALFCKLPGPDGCLDYKKAIYKLMQEWGNRCASLGVK